MNAAPRILIVDDEPRMCESLQALLAGRDYEVRTARSGTEAMGRLAEGRFDVAVLDLYMPDMTGHELMERIFDRGGGTLVIVITGNASVDSAVRALKRGAYDFIKKPFEFDEFLKTIQNALEQQRLQHQTREMNGRLALSEERYRYLVRNSPDIIYTLDPEGRFTFVSDAAEALLGVPGPNLIGRHYKEVVASEDLDRCQWNVHERRTGKRATQGVELRLKVVGAEEKPSDGRDLVVGELKSTGMYEQTNGPESRHYVGTHGVIRDITLRKQLEDRLEQAGRSEALGTLASGIAHNFNNILQAIQTNASLCLLDLDPGSKHYERCRNIVRYVDNGANLTRQLMGFAKGGPAEVRPADLNELVRQSGELFGKTRKEVRVHIDLQEDLWTAEVDARQIEQVLMNVFVNAWHAMPEGGDLYVETANVHLGPAHAALSGIEPGPFVRIRVRDTGTGMDEEVRQRVFEPFFTTKEVGQGTGLGMASAYGVVKQHGGLIDLKSQKGRGTACSICLPACPEKQPALGVEAAAGTVVKGQETLLLVDDDEMVLETARELLSELGYTVITAKSGAEALDIYQARWKEIDLVILDLVMPGMGGGEVFDGMKMANPEVVCLLSTGHSLDGPAGAVLDRGCAGHLQKPFDLTAISGEIQKALDRETSPVE